MRKLKDRFNREADDNQSFNPLLTKWMSNDIDEAVFREVMAPPPTIAAGKRENAYKKAPA